MQTTVGWAEVMGVSEVLALPCRFTRVPREANTRAQCSRGGFRE